MLWPPVPHALPSPVPPCPPPVRPAGLYRPLSAGGEARRLWGFAGPEGPCRLRALRDGAGARASGNKKDDFVEKHVAPEWWWWERERGGGGLTPPPCGGSGAPGRRARPGLLPAPPNGGCLGRYHGGRLRLRKCHGGRRKRKTLRHVTHGRFRVPVAEARGGEGGGMRRGGGGGQLGGELGALGEAGGRGGSSRGSWGAQHGELGELGGCGSANWGNWG